MAVSYRRSLIIICILILILVNFFCFWLGYQNYLEPKLGSFKPLEIIESNGQFYLKIEPSNHATHYEVNVINQQGETILTAVSEEETIPLIHLKANYNDKLKFKVTAKNKNGTVKEADEILEIEWKNASLVNYNTRYINAESGLNLMIYGYDSLESYQLKLEYLNQTIYEEKVKDHSIFIPYEVLDGYAGRISAKLYTKQNTLISSYNFFLNTPIVGKVNLHSPVNGKKTRYNDILLNINGGENATELALLIYQEGNLENTIILPKGTKEYRLPANFLTEEKNYQIKIEARYLDYQEITEKDEVTFYVGKKETTEPVFVSHNPSFIKKGTEVTLNTTTPSATIYYTLDGSTPTKESFIYKTPFKIEDNVTIRTFAVSNNRYDSAINTYNFQIKEKQLVIYLSPSNQRMNYGVKEVGFQTEMIEMNKLADVVEQILKENGVKVYRNHPNATINDYINESNYIKSDLHFAIHSNASKSKLAQGIEIYIDQETSCALSVAHKIYHNLYQIYPRNKIPETNRGIKYARGAFGEVNDSFLSCGALIEVAYHDNLEDAKWIMENREEIGNNIASSILSYYN
ncbi:MAG: hypothetical protein HFH86_02665 [Bacilli bacterium]|nr:hypothetical protein [Bacilli bacterium]